MAHFSRTAGLAGGENVAVAHFSEGAATPDWENVAVAHYFGTASQAGR